METFITATSRHGFISEEYELFNTSAVFLQYVFCRRKFLNPGGYALMEGYHKQA